MAPHPDLQLEKLIDRALKHSDFQPLEDFLECESNEALTPKFSKNFINKLDKLISRELDKGNISHASLGLTCLHKFGKVLVTPGSQDLAGVVDQGLVIKMVSWFEKARKLWMEPEKFGSEALLSLAEDFLDALLVIHDNSKEGKYQVTERFLHLLGHLATEPQVHILIQKEVVRKLNVILNSSSPELKKEREILSSEEALAIVKKLAIRILESGDYDLQISLMEALCRMTSRRQREELASSWFKMDFLASAFLNVQDTEFETDTRKFLNLLNGMKGDKRRVYSFPCLEAFLGKHELLMPSDEKLEEFWVDFNLESRSISFYFSRADELESQWDTVCIPENEVHSYTVKEEANIKVLKLLLIDSLCLDGIEGSELVIHFSCSLDILHAVVCVYGSAKHRKCAGKMSSSVAVTPVQVILHDGNSQAIVPESQLSSAPSMDREQSRARQSCSVQEDLRPGPQQERTVTPVKRKVSESSTCVSSMGSRKLGMSPLSSILVTPLSRAKVKPALKMVSSTEKKKDYTARDLKTGKTSISTSVAITQCQGRSEQDNAALTSLQNKASIRDLWPAAPADKFRRNIPAERVVEMVQANQDAMDNTNIVPDSQCSRKSEKSLLPIQTDAETRRSKCSVPDVLLQAPGWKNTLAVGVQQRTGEVSHQQFHLQLTKRLEGILQQKDQETPSKGVCTQAGQEEDTAQAPEQQGPAPEPQDIGGWKPSRPESTGSGSRAKKAAVSDLTSHMTTFITSQYKSTTATSTTAPGSEPVWTSAGRNKSKEEQREKYWSSTPKWRRANGWSKGSDTSLQPPSNMKTAAEPPDHDVYSFPMDTSEKEEDLKGKSAICSAHMDHGNISRSVNKGPPPVKPHSHRVKKHLFSDSDTDNKGDVSWLRDSAQKPRPKVTQYGRRAPRKSARVSDEADLPYALPKEMDKSSQPKKARPKKDKRAKDNVASPAVSRPSGRPQRASAMSKNYREPSDFSSTSQSEEEASQHQQQVVVGKPKKTMKTTQQPEAKTMSAPPVKDVIENQMTTWTAQCSALTSPLSPVERMRSVEKHVALQRSSVSPLCSLFCVGISPLETPSSQKGTQAYPFSTISRNNVGTEVPCPPCLFSVGRKTSSPLLAPSCPSQPQPSPVQPLLTSTAQEMSGAKSRLSCQPPEERLHESGSSPILSASFLQNALVSMATQSQGTLELQSSLALTGELEKTPAPSTRQSKPSQLKEHRSGPCQSLKRRASPPSSSTSEEERQKKLVRQREYCGKLKPRKLFKPRRSHLNEEIATASSYMSLTPLRGAENSFEEESEDEEGGTGKGNRVPESAQKSFHSVQRNSATDTDRGNVEVHSIISSHMVSSCWETNVDTEVGLGIQDLDATQNLGSVCHQLNSDLQRKLQNRSRRMKLFFNQLLKVKQQHISSICVQVKQYRIQNLEKIKAALLEEIRKLEQDGSTLKNMEKELTVFWSEQRQAFHSIQEKNAQRVQHLRSTFQANVCHSLGNEDRLFNSEMCLMKEDIKSVQDKFYRDMHEENLLSVQRALRAWVLPESAGL